MFWVGRDKTNNASNSALGPRQPDTGGRREEESGVPQLLWNAKTRPAASAVQPGSPSRGAAERATGSAAAKVPARWTQVWCLGGGASLLEAGRHLGPRVATTPLRATSLWDFAWAWGEGWRGGAAVILYRIGGF